MSENKPETMLDVIDKGTRINREAWLWDAAKLIEPLIRKEGFMVPNFHISVGFPSRNALSKKRRTIGQCYAGTVSQDGNHQIFISPLIVEPVEVVGVVAHEMIHATVGVEHGHKAPFAHLARKIGLTGKMTATVPGPELTELIKSEFLPVLEDYPHPLITPNEKYKPQATRLLKAVCTECGYTARVTAKWVEQSGSLICPTHLKPLDVQGYGEVVLNDDLMAILRQHGVDLSLVNQPA